MTVIYVLLDILTLYLS